MDISIWVSRRNSQFTMFNTELIISPPPRPLQTHTIVPPCMLCFRERYHHWFSIGSFWVLRFGSSKPSNHAYIFCSGFLMVSFPTTLCLPPFSTVPGLFVKCGSFCKMMWSFFCLSFLSISITRRIKFIFLDMTYKAKIGGGNTRVGSDKKMMNIVYSKF